LLLFLRLLLRFLGILYVFQNFFLKFCIGGPKNPTYAGVIIDITRRW
jgi:hypothetical protein